jgi:hypothetical protein
MPFQPFSGSGNGMDFAQYVAGRRKAMKKILVIMAVLLFSASFVMAEEEQAYTNLSVARLSFLTGNTYLQRAADLAYEDGQVNAPITEGDRLGTTGGRAEVALNRGNFLRLDTDTKVDFLNLPDKNTTLTRMKVWTGNVYLSIQSLLKEKAFEVHTPDASIYVLEEGLFRMDVMENEKTEILVFEGAVEVAGQDGSNILSGGQKIEVADGRFLSRPTRLMAAADDNFDAWNTDREALTRKQLASHYLPEDLWEYEYELDQYGDWRLMPSYGYVWIPRGLGSSWRPYYHGRWSWIPFCGWTWVGYDPWGWAPYHYGRWQWDPMFGWYWIPTSIWGPAWVSWWWGWDYYGWAPLGWYGYPGVIINNRYYDRYHGDYPYDSRALTVVHKNQLKAPDVSKVVVSSDKLRSVEKIAMTTDGRLAPRPEGFRNVSIEKLNNGRVFLRSTGSSGSDERLIRGRTTGTATEDSGRGTTVQKRDTNTTQSQGRSGGQDSSATPRRITERPSRDDGSSNSGQGQGTSQGNSGERKIRKKNDGQESSASASFRSNSFSGYPSSLEGSSSGYSVRSSSIYNSIFRLRSSARSTILSSYGNRSTSRSSSGSSSISRSSSSSRSSRSSSSSSRSSSGRSSSSGSVRRKN